MAPHFILDTNIFVHLVRNDAVGRRIIGHYRLMSVQPVPVYSIVTAGEIECTALRNGWGDAKLSRLKFLLDHFQRRHIDSEKFVTNYAVLDSYARDHGQRMGKNDLWIATTAYISNQTLLTTDRDFDLLSLEMIDRDWIDPNLTP